MDSSLIYSGRFVSSGATSSLVVRGEISWIRLLNETEAAATNINHGFEYFWQRNMTPGRGTVWYHPAADHTVAVNEIAVGAGFTLNNINTVAPVFGPAVVITGASNVVQPIIATGSTAGLSTGSIVRLDSVTGAESLGGFEFEIDTVVPATSFRMRYAMANAAGAAGTAGHYRLMQYGESYQPQHYYILNITQAANAIITTSISHNLIVGQRVRINLADSRFGMTEINGLTGTVIATTAGTVTVNINSTAFSAFTFALPASVPFTMPLLVPYGENTSAALTFGTDILADARRNTADYVLTMQAGLLSPIGTIGDVISYYGGRAYDL